MWRHAGLNDHINVEPFHNDCIFCRTTMVSQRVDSFRHVDEEIIAQHHLQAVEEGILYAGYPREHREITSDMSVFDVCFQCCPICGWWNVLQQVEYDVIGNSYQAYQYAAGALAKNSDANVEQAISEVRRYLCAKFDFRFEINPVKLEEVIASVFRSLKCDVELTSLSNDGGIDVFGYDQAGEVFGVQVKRYRERIKISQLREFVGALLLDGTPRGIFVTTSDFTAGASKLCEQAHLAGIQLELVDSKKLFEMIKAAQIEDFDIASVGELAEAYLSNIETLNFSCTHHIRSL